MNVTVSTHTTAIEAHIVRGRLEAEGIPAFVLFEHHIWAKWTLSVALGGVRVQVPTLYVEKAAEVLNYIDSGGYQIGVEGGVDNSISECCPSCNAVTAKQVSWSWKLAFLAVFLVSVPVPYFYSIEKCTVCSYACREPKQRAYPFYLKVFCVFVLWIMLVVIFVLWNHWCKFYCEQPVWI
jgi:hypothetical protein